MDGAVNLCQAQSVQHRIVSTLATHQVAATLGTSAEAQARGQGALFVEAQNKNGLS